MYSIVVFACFKVILCAPTDYNLDTINDFSLKFLDNVAVNQDGNFAISGVSVWNLFSLLAEGSAGETFTQLMTQLRLPKDLKSTQILHRKLDSVLISNSKDVTLNRKAVMFGDCSLNIHQEFCQSANNYNTDVYTVDTANKTKLANDINYFICISTEGNIRGAVNEEMLEDLRLLLVDATYFKANWTYRFDSIETRPESFYDHHGRTIGKVNMMHQKAPNTVSYVDELQAELLEMPYGRNKEFAMMILQPIQGSTVKQLLKKLSQKPFEEWSSNLKSSDNLPEIDCYVPRFKISSQMDLIQPLKYMGIYDIFDETKALLPGVSDTPLYVSKTIQKVLLEVNEEGTIAAAATIVGLENRIMGQRAEINRPFVYLILEKRTNLILFAGVYTEPSIV